MCDQQDDNNYTHELPAKTFVQRLGNRIDDEGMTNTPDDDACIKDANTVSEVFQKGATMYAALILGAYQSSC